MERPTAWAPKPDWIEYAEHLDLDVDGMTRSQIIDAVDAREEAAQADRPPPGSAEPGRIPLASEFASSITTRQIAQPHYSRLEQFTGPATQLALSQDPDPTTVVVHDTAQRRDVDVTVEGRTIHRTDGHFGRGGNRWHVSYRPNR